MTSKNSVLHLVFVTFKLLYERWTLKNTYCIKMSAAMSKATRNTKIVKKLNFQESHIGQHYGLIYSFNAFYTCTAYLMFKGSIV